MVEGSSNGAETGQSGQILAVTVVLWPWTDQSDLLGSIFSQHQQMGKGLWSALADTQDPSGQ